MARPKTIVDGRHRSVFLPVALIDQIDVAAQKRGLKASVVVRTILEAGIKRYLAKSDNIWKQRLADLSDELKKDPEIFPLYEKFKDVKEMTIPADVTRLTKKMTTLLEAMNTYRLVNSV
jgi:hypothetical protein